MATRSRQEKWSCPVSVPLLVDINERVLQEDLDHLREIKYHSQQQWTPARGCYPSPEPPEPSSHFLWLLSSCW